MSTLDPADDPLVSHRPDKPEAGWFDRFYVNLHSGASTPYLLIGGGVYPEPRVVDGYVITTTTTEQRNLRVSTQFEGQMIPSQVGPLAWETIEPGHHWRVRLGDNPTGVAFELDWHSRTLPWACAPIHLDDGRGRTARFEHAFQSGYHNGWIEIDGEQIPVEGWFGQRDRSRGTRMATARQGIHLWVQAQFDEEVVAFILDLDRQGERTLLDGAVMPRTGTPTPIVEIAHRLSFDDRLECTGATFLLETATGRQLLLDADPTVTGGGFLSGGGYGGWHGKPRGSEHTEHERWMLDDPSITPRALDMPMVDRLARFSCREKDVVRHGAGIFEFAHTRSPAFAYEPTLDSGFAVGASQR